MRYILVLIALFVVVPAYAVQTIEVNGTQINICSDEHGMRYCTKMDEMKSIMFLLNYKPAPVQNKCKVQKFRDGVYNGTNAVTAVGDSLRSIGGFFGRASF